MTNTFRPWQLLSVIIAGMLNEQQQQIIEYLKEENRILRAQIGDRRLRLSDDDRRRLAAKGKALGRRVLGEICCIVTPETILRWHRKLTAIKYDGSANRRPGRPRVMEEIRRLTVRMAIENPGWSYERIQGALRAVGRRVAETTIRNILKENGLEPAPARRKRRSWKTFLQAHFESYRRDGLLHRRDLDPARPDPALGDLCHRSTDPPHRGRWHQRRALRIMDRARLPIADR